MHAAETRICWMRYSDADAADICCIARRLVSHESSSSCSSPSPSPYRRRHHHHHHQAARNRHHDHHNHIIIRATPPRLVITSATIILSSSSSPPPSLPCLIYARFPARFPIISLYILSLCITTICMLAASPPFVHYQHCNGTCICETPLFFTKIINSQKYNISYSSGGIQDATATTRTCCRSRTGEARSRRLVVTRT